MRTRLVLLTLVTVPALLLAPMRAARGTEITPIPKRELVLKADFVGAVECEVAGGLVAEYRVVESWKGSKVGDRIRIQLPPNFWGQQYPLALCGARYFVTAFKAAPAENRASWTVGGDVPLWWRAIPADYSTPLLQGWDQMSTGKDDVAKFDTFRKEMQDLLALTPRELEARFLREEIAVMLDPKYRLGKQGDEIKTLKKLVEKKAGTDELVRELIRLARLTDKDDYTTVWSLLNWKGGEDTLAQLEKVPADKSPWGKKRHEDLVEYLRARLTKPKPEAPEPRPEPKPPSEEMLKEFRTALAAGPTGKGFEQALAELSRHDPATVAEFLIGWKAGKLTRKEHPAYVRASTFAVLCGKDREKHFTALLAAEEPYVRAAGAVYLCYENEEKGVAALKKLTALKGDAGAWAALTLARRGHKDAVPRLLEVFDEPFEETEESDLRSHANLQSRTVELLSNAAKSAGVPQPVEASETGWGGSHPPRKRMIKWWKQHGEKVKPRDPWLEPLAKQKVD